MSKTEKDTSFFKEEDNHEKSRVGKLTINISKSNGEKTYKDPYPALHSDGRYIITGTLNSSLFGSVKIAFDRIRLRQVAIKISKNTLNFHGKTRHNIAVLENVKHEARMLRMTSLLDKESHIVKLIDERVDDENHYLITEYGMAGDLSKLILTIKNNKLEEKLVRVITKQLVHAIKVLHHSFIFHADISLENICLKENGDALLTDFGLASSIIDISQDISGTKYSAKDDRYAYYKDKEKIKIINNRFIKPGKKAYMSPELYDGKDWDPFANDIWCLGVVIYMIGTGRPPYEVPGIDKKTSDTDVWFEAIYSGKWLHYAKCEYKYTDIYSCLSEDLLSLLNRIFKSQDVRPTIDDIANDKWLNSQD